MNKSTWVHIHTITLHARQWSHIRFLCCNIWSGSRPTRWEALLQATFTHQQCVNIYKSERLLLYRHHELLCKSSSIQPNSFAVVVHLTPRTNTQNKRKPASYRKAPSSSCNRFLTATQHLRQKQTFYRRPISKISTLQKSSWSSYITLRSFSNSITIIYTDAL